MVVYNLTSKNFSVTGGQKPSLNISLKDPLTMVFFKQEGCPACGAFEPIFAQIVANEHGISYAVCDLSGQNREIIQKSRSTSTAITAVPFILMYQAGRPLAKFNGKRDVPSIMSFIQKIKGMVSERSAPVTRLDTRPAPSHAPQGVPDDDDDQMLMTPQNVIPHNKPWNADGFSGKYH